jgi:hypothetical protein
VWLFEHAQTEQLDVADGLINACYTSLRQEILEAEIEIYSAQ